MSPMAHVIRIGSTILFIIAVIINFFNARAAAETIGALLGNRGGDPWEGPEWGAFAASFFSNTVYIVFFLIIALAFAELLENVAMSKEYLRQMQGTNLNQIQGTDLEASAIRGKPQPRWSCSKCGVPNDLWRKDCKSCSTSKSS